MFNSMEDRVYHMFMYHDTVHRLWTALTQMYAHAHNESRIFELYREISHASQTTLGLSVADYFAYLQTRWEELAQYEPLSDFPSDGAILNTSPMPFLYEAFAIVDGDERRRHLLPSLSLPESSLSVPDQRAFATSSGPHLYCQHCHKPNHLIDRCWVLHPEMKQQFSRPRGGGRSGGKSRGTPRTGAVPEVEPIPSDLPDFKQLQLQIAQLPSHLGLAHTSQSSGPTAAIVVETPTALHDKLVTPTWILDYRKNNHMTGELTTFTSLVTSVHQSICIADGSFIPIRSQGDARLSSDITISFVIMYLILPIIFFRRYERDGQYYFGDPLPSSVSSSSLHVFSPPVLESFVLSPSDDPIPPRPLPILEPPSSPPPPNGSLALIVSQDPSPRAQDPLPAFFSEVRYVFPFSF
ncbi:hypothetical protein Acr_11g0014990 [Actinidia rufa]|uniref:Uncharacterized protein n=1 Tax=Actinidia rufa TaxID=165716 RepID=A0A7J0FF00_9ERIC|nr:hypothetical protein Acr_11g0014990 [Actinidia rufa]